MRRPRPRPRGRGRPGIIARPKASSERGRPKAGAPSSRGEAPGLESSSDHAAEAAFRLGLRRLFVDSDPEGSLEALRVAIRGDAAPWSRQARVSAGQILLATGRPQQAAFELRKASADDASDLLAALARSLLVDALRTLGKGSEAERVRDQQKRALAALAAEGGAESARASAWLGFEHKHDGQRREARAALEAALASSSLPHGEREAVERALDAL